MKKRQYEWSSLKHKLSSKRHNGQKSVIWSLSPEQYTYVSENLGYTVYPFIFQIFTKKIVPEARNTALLKEIHHARCDGKSRIAKKLSSREQKLLSEHDIYFVPLKYKILLQA